MYNNINNNNNNNNIVKYINDNDNMYQPGETQNQNCINLSERRSFYRK